MQLKSSSAQNGLLTPTLVAKSTVPSPSGGSGEGEGAAIGGPSEFARMLEMQSKNTQLTAAQPPSAQSLKAQTNKALDAVPGPASRAAQASGQSAGTRPSGAQAPERQSSSSVNNESNRLVQKQAERSRLQAQSESRASAARGNAPQSARAMKNEKAAPEKAVQSQGRQAGSQESDKAPDASSSAQSVSTTIPPWLAFNTAGSTPSGSSVFSQDVVDGTNSELGPHGVTGFNELMSLQAKTDLNQETAASDTSDLPATASFGTTLAGSRQTALATTGAAKPGQRGSAEVSAAKAQDAVPLSSLLSATGEPGAAPRGGADITALMPSLAEQVARTSSSEKAGAQDFALLLAAQSPSAAAEQAAPVSVELSTHVRSPEFREHLGAQVSVLAKEGVQAAELHLNPADMGPISVQITLDGTQARVDFGADSATTRQLIESGLPELASAMREAGLTLSGGGVSQHARGRSDQERSSDQRARGNDTQPVAEAGPSTAPIARRVALGGVDVFA